MSLNNETSIAHVIQILNKVTNITSCPHKIKGTLTTPIDGEEKEILVEVRQTINNFRVTIDVFMQLDEFNSDKWATVYRNAIEVNSEIVKAWCGAENRETRNAMQGDTKQRETISSVLSSLIL